MKNTVMRFMLATTFSLVAFSGSVRAAGDITLTRNAAIGVKFHAPGPRTCSTHAQPSSGPLTPSQARAYVICDYEKDDQGGVELLYLATKVVVQVSRGRPYEHVRDSLESIDPHKLVYDIRGTSVIYSCNLWAAPEPADASGRAIAWPHLPVTRTEQCRRTLNENDAGKCYQTTFDEWRCTWGDMTAPMTTDTRTLVPTPSLAEAE